MTPIASEDAILGLIDQLFPRAHKSLVLSRGDDCAELAVPESQPGKAALALSTDLFWEDVHFRRSYASLKQIGHKALAVNLSDLAGAGVEPLAFSLGLMLPAGFSLEECSELLTGMADLAEQHDLALSGGDLSASLHSGLGFCITIWGAPAAGHDPLRRREAKPGDLLFLIHPLGLRVLGLPRLALSTLEREGASGATRCPAAVQALLEPLPMVPEGRKLAWLSEPESRIGLMDLSDGLTRDLPRLLGAGAKGPGAGLNINPEALHPELTALGLGQALETALLGGEEYALLGSCPPALRAEVAGLGARFIGTVNKKPGLYCNGEPFPPPAFDHFDFSRRPDIKS